jgi:MFS family permease
MLFFAGLTAAVFALHEVPQEGWGSKYVLSLFGVSAAMMVVFVEVEARTRTPILDLNLFRSRTFSAGAASAIVNYIGVNAVIFLFPFYFVTYHDYSLSEASLVLTAMPLSMMITAPFSGYASDKIGSRMLATSGMCGLAMGMLLLGLIGKDGGVLVFPPLVIVGISAGLFAPPNNSAIMGAAPKHQQGVAASVLATARNVGLGLGVALASSLFRQRLDDGAVEAFQFVNISLAGLMLVGAVTSFTRGSRVPAATPAMAEAR